LRAAEDFIKSNIESLREGIAPLCLDKGKKFLSLQHRYLTKAKTVIRMEQDDDYVPISSRVDFKVKALKEAEELPELIELQNETKAIIKTHQQSLKLLIIKSCTIEEDRTRHPRGSWRINLASRWTGTQCLHKPLSKHFTGQSCTRASLPSSLALPN
jgi:hypothetical protein